jgi:hypothetical protein
MHKNIKNLIYIQNEIKSKIFENKIKDYNPNIIAISKTFKIDHILPLIEYGHIHFGENKIQEAMDKWSEIKNKNIQIKLHMVGKLQTNKVKFAIKIFDYIHSVDNIKLAKKISDEQKNNNKKPKIFIQLNISNEVQKSGISKSEIKYFYNYCKELGLDVIGTMCLPPNDNKSEIYFSEMKKINQELGLSEISMGMSDDYLIALKYHSTFLRIGSKIFGQRS